MSYWISVKSALGITRISPRQFFFLGYFIPVAAQGGGNQKFIHMCRINVMITYIWWIMGGQTYFSQFTWFVGGPSRGDCHPWGLVACGFLVYHDIGIFISLLLSVLNSIIIYLLMNFWQFFFVQRKYGTLGVTGNIMDVLIRVSESEWRNQKWSMGSSLL